MRNGVGAGFPHHDRYSDAQALLEQAAKRPLTAQTHSAHSYSNTYRQADNARTNIARLFVDLRGALRVTPQQVALHLQTSQATIFALEAGDFEHLPAWSETARVVIAYTALAGIDGRPVLAALADSFRQSQDAPLLLAAPSEVPYQARALMPVPQPTVATVQQPGALQPASRPAVSKIFAAGSALANGAKRFPAGALHQVRQRPQRALYAVSMPLAIVLLLLNSSALEAAFSHVPRPIARAAQDMRSYFQVHFAPVREGLRWIEVDDPRRRRGDKLR